MDSRDVHGAMELLSGTYATVGTSSGTRNGDKDELKESHGWCPRRANMHVVGRSVVTTPKEYY